MKKESKLSRLISLLLTFMKVGLFTFGGGYAMIPIIEEQVSRKKHWIEESEILDIIAISESTPGPISVNTATYVGYKVAGILGAIVSTLGLALPSFIIIFIISFFYKDFMQIHFFDAAFKGLKIGVILLLLNAVIKLGKSFKKNAITLIIFSLVLITSIVFSFLNTGFNYLTLILIGLGILIGIMMTALSRTKGESKK